MVVAPPWRMQSLASDRRVLGRRDPAPLRIARSEGSFVYDESGRKYIDFLMGWCVGNFGWGNPELLDAIAEFKGPEYVYPGFAYARWTELAELLVSIAPKGLAKCFRATGGSEAVEIALQAALLHTRRRKLLSLEGSYHGNTLATLSVGASETREPYPNLLPNCQKIEPPLDASALAKIETRLRKRDVAAFLMEPISINLGVSIPEPDCMQELQQLCRRHGTLLVMDEVATGFGRTGKLFASDHFDLEPDLLCLGKAITNGLGAMGATLATEAVAKSLEEQGNFYSTYGWHPRSVAAAIATTRYAIRNQEALLRNIAAVSGYFQSRLSQLARSRWEIRVQGLAIGVDLADENEASKVQERCRRQGLLVATEGATLLLLPALTIDPALAEQGLDLLEAVTSRL
jgi:acetylornithine/succinyldiaminopimelate/putrescine aminotransferase